MCLFAVNRFKFLDWEGERIFAQFFQKKDTFYGKI